MLWKCHAGCEQRAVGDSLKQRGLLNGRSHRLQPAANRESPDQAARRLSAGALRDGFKFEALYTYSDSNGQPLYWRIRGKHADGRKWVRPMRRGASGLEIGEPKFSNGKPLYGLQQIARSAIGEPVFIVEGENKVDALGRVGVLATTSGSASSANGADWAVLKGRPCIVWRDFDDAGLGYARDVTLKLGVAGAKLAAWIDAAKIGLKVGDDCVDWLAAHPTATRNEVLNGLPIIAAEALGEMMAKIKSEPSTLPASEAPEEAWQQPLGLISRTVADPYPLDALPGAIGDAVREVVTFVQCPPSLAAMSALAAVSLAGQALADVRRSGKLLGPVSLYFLAVADSGERKTTCDTFFSTAVRDWEQQQAESAKPDIAAHEAALGAWQVKREGVLAAIKKAAQGAKPTDLLEEALRLLEAQKPKAPRVPRLRHGDTTPEAIAWNLGRGWPSGGVLSSEAGIVFGGHGMSRDSVMRNLALLNLLWDGGTLKVDRRTSESFTVSGTRLTMGLAVQPDTVRAFFDGTDGLARGSGFAARFLIAWPQSTQGSRAFTAGPDHWPNLARFLQRITELMNKAPTINERGELEPQVLDLSVEARAAWIQFHNEVEGSLGPGGDMAETRDVASKAADNAARLAALFHLFEAGSAQTIGEAHMRAACKIITWHLYEARRFFGELALPAVLANAVKLDAWLLRHCREKGTASVSTRTIQREGPGPLRDRRALEAALRELLDAGRVREVRDGRQKLVQVNPSLLDGGEHGAA